MADKEVKKSRESKTKPTDVPVEEFLKGVGDKRAREANIIIDIMRAISGEEATMWGPSIIGFGSEEYSSSSGCYGQVPKIAFSPRKAKLTFYFNAGFHEYGKLMDRLGKYTTSVSCLYVNKLEDIDLEVLREMIEITWKGSSGVKKEITSTEEYIESIAEETKEDFLKIRDEIKKILVDSEEVYSYGILGFKTDKKRAKVYLSGFKDHIGIYPVPKDEGLRLELKDYIRGKGTLWITKDKPLKEGLLEKIVKKLVEEANLPIKRASKKEKGK